MDIKETPMMKQYLGFKKQYPNKILLFRMGDFFETFGEDAKITSKVLNITLTTRDKNTNPTPLAGFPHKALDQYLPKLIKGGHNVVIVDQIEDPKISQGIVKRGVTRIVTPGTLDGEQANNIKNTYIASFNLEKDTLYTSMCDISTGEFFWIMCKNTKNNIENILSSYTPEEIILLEGEDKLHFPEYPIHFVQKTYRNTQYSEEKIKEFFEIKGIQSLGIENNTVTVAMILGYIEETQLMDPKHIQKPKQVKLGGYMALDRATIRNLEIISNSYTGETKGSLLSILDNTKTNMGKRLLYFWLLNPLIEAKKINERLEKIEQYIQNRKNLEEIRNILGNINDIERIVGKIGLNRVSPKDIIALQTSLESVLKIKELKIEKDKVEEIIKEIDKTVKEEPSNILTEGNIIKDGFDNKVDELRKLTGNSKEWIKDFVEQEKKKTGISSLKMGFNKIFGYYLEVTKTHQDKVPDTYIRKQTLVNCERYITEELKEKESLILNAEVELFELEYKLFQIFKDSILKYIPLLQEVSKKVANLDVLTNFAYISIENNYTKPTMYEMGKQDGVLKIEKGRHPIIEKLTEEFISNDTYLDFKNSNMAILTGPNMSGKSTYIRQVATIVLMAQIGCYIPAKDAQISVVDRIFTRVGASDDLSRGRSTFMVEMDEAANIVNNASKYSLVVLDEVGRGTSTYDGVSIAWALAEHLVSEVKARTLFATHYHELLKLAERNPDKVKNYNVLVEEDIEKGTVIFLRKIVEGGTDRSYGIYVAKMAGLPEKVIKRANELLESFEQEQMFVDEKTVRNISKVKQEETKINGYQYPLFLSKDSKIEKDIQSLNTDNMTPIEALQKIIEWKKQL